MRPVSLSKFGGTHHVTSTEAKNSTEYVVTRIDSHGSEFEVQRFRSENEAIALMKDLEAKGHHQHYYYYEDDGSHKSRMLFRD
jgi:hypothetical protein